MTNVTDTKAAIMAALRLGMAVILRWDPRKKFYLVITAPVDAPTPKFSKTPLIHSVACALIRDRDDLVLKTWQTTDEKSQSLVCGCLQIDPLAYGVYYGKKSPRWR